MEKRHTTSTEQDWMKQKRKNIHHIANCGIRVLIIHRRKKNISNNPMEKKNKLWKLELLLSNGMRFEIACVRLSHIFIPIRNHFEFASWILIWVFISIIVTVHDDDEGHGKWRAKKKWRNKKRDLSITEKKKANNGGTWNSLLTL